MAQHLEVPASYEKPTVSDYGDLTELTAGFAGGSRADIQCNVGQVCTFLSGP